MSAVKPASKADSTPSDDTDADAGTSQLEQRISEYARIGGPVVVLIAAIGAGSLAGPPTAVLVLAGGALVAVIAIFWASLRLLLGETPLSGADAYALGAPRAEEEQKQSVLRALKDLEFERSVGKISEEDYAELVTKYRAEAKRLLRLLDEEAQPRREHVEALVAKRLRRAGLADDLVQRVSARRGGDAARDEEDADADAGADADTDTGADADTDTDVAPKTGACASCGTVNDADAVFCKKCGVKCSAVKEPATARESADADDSKDQNGEAS
jgi:hypothetical protein